MRKSIFILIFILLSLFLVSCSEKTSPSTKKSNHDKENIIQTSISSKNSNTTASKNNETKVNSNNDSSTTESKPKIRTDGKWLQCDARLYYLQGTVKQIEKKQDGQISMTLLVEKAFQNPTSGVVIPYNIGKEYSFFLKEMPTIDLTNHRVIIYGGGITSNDQNRFLGAKIVYYNKNNRFVDFNGKEAVLPPTDYPYELK